MIAFDTKSLPEEYETAPDGSEIRPLLRVSRGSMAHCTLPSASTSCATAHKMIEEIWHCIEGKGRFWRRKAGVEKTVDVGPGVSLTIPAGTHFQFRNTSGGPLRFIITTMPPWPGNEEAVKVQGKWEPEIKAKEIP